MVTSIGESQVQLSYGSVQPSGKRGRGLGRYVSISSDRSYVIRYRKVVWCQQDQWIKITQTKCDSHTFTNLIPGTSYEFSVEITIDGQLPVIDCGSISVRTETAIVGKCCVNVFIIIILLLLFFKITPGSIDPRGLKTRIKTRLSGVALAYM